MLFDTVVLDGDMELLIPFDGEIGVVTNIREALPAYDGPTEITPTQETQTLATAEKTVLENIVVNPIPSNYGLVTYNGAILTIS